MVGAGNVVADRFRRVASKKHRTGVMDTAGERIRVVDREFQMLGREAVDQPDRLVPVAHDDDRAIRVPALLRD